MSKGTGLLRILADGRFHSGEALGQVLGISRTAVWKQLQVLKLLGLDIFSVPGKGYRLVSPIELLAEETIRESLPVSARGQLSGLEIHQQIDSTSDELRRRAAGLSSAFACLAETQSAGRGRRNRTWSSPYARNLYLSLLWRFRTGPDALSGLGLAVGVALLRALSDLGVQGVGLKWPNDLLWQEAKLAGTLIEMTGESGDSSSVVIGIGINVEMPAALGAGIDQPWTDLATAGRTSISRNRLAAVVLARLFDMLTEFEQSGIAPFVDEWRRQDILNGRPVVLTGANGEVAGIARGIDATGALLIEGDGGIKRYLSGDVSLRALDRIPDDRHAAAIIAGSDA